MFRRLLIPFLRRLPVLPQRIDKSLVVGEVGRSRLVPLDGRRLKGNKLRQTQDDRPRVVRVTQELRLVLGHGDDLHVRAAVQQVEELDGELAILVGGQVLLLLAALDQLGQGF